jgi:peptidyl-dipeptidase A
MRTFPGVRLPASWLAGVGLLLSLAGGAAARADEPLPAPAAPPSPAARQAPPTAAAAEKFIADASRSLYDLSLQTERASWVHENFITVDTEALAAAADEKLTAESVKLAKEAVRFDPVQVPPDVRRQLDLLKLSLTLPAPNDPKKIAELSHLAAELESLYGSGRYCPPGVKEGDCIDIQKAGDIFEKSRDPKQLLDVWVGWHAIARPMRDDYRRMVEIANEGARELGYKDTGALWRAKYDMPPDAFAAEVDRLWGQVKPLYDSLHCYVRVKLNQKYGNDLVPLDKPIPAHLLGNMWAQTWDNDYDLMAPPNADPGYNLTERLQAKKTDYKQMVRYGEGFFTSLGFAPLPKTFWERSMLVQPVDHDAVCHANAWDLDHKEDLRIKMCVKINAEDFSTIHHELGHNMYQRAYNKQPFLFQDSANDGFHEAVGDTVALSVTPEYLQKIGLIDRVPDPSKDLGLLLKQALEKVAFLPFGLLIDQWRWKVFSGEIKPSEYNRAWWQLREKYQGVRAPVPRTEADFDPGAKYHVPGNTPYTRYFLAQILQYQFHRALCATAGYQGPLHRCSIYGNKAAGERLNRMLEMGISRPWPEALKVLTGEDRMDATAIVDYFAPLKTWLDAQNKGQKCGW